jgi:integrase
MGVKVTKRGKKFFVFVTHHGQRKAKCVGTSRDAAEEVKRELEARLALRDLGFLAADKKQVPTFDAYSQRWLREYAAVECKPSTVRSYEQLLRVHVTPRFGEKPLTEITREQIKTFVTGLSQAYKVVNELKVRKFSRNTLRLIVCALRSVLGAAVEDGLIASNPASKVGRFIKTEKPVRQASAMTRDEAERFLDAIEELTPEWRPFFLAALRGGLRKGELIALTWGDIQFGESAEDPNRYILVQRNWSHGHFTSPKGKKSRRVDLSKQLRGVLMDLRDSRLLAAMMAGNTSIADELVFPSRAGTVLKPDNIAPRYMAPALAKAGLRHFRFHDLRHTFGSLLIHDGASLTYVKEQMGHSSIQITVDTYGHLIPGADIAWIDRLDAPSAQQQHATQVQPASEEAKQEDVQLVERNWLPPRDSNPDMLIQSQLSCR